MNKKETKDTRSAMELTGGVFRDLFHKDSAKCIVNANDLALVDFGYMKDIVSSMFNKEQLTFVDTKKLAVFDLGALVLFFQYFGIFSAFFIINLGVVSAYLLNNGSLKTMEMQAAKPAQVKFVKANKFHTAAKPTYIAYAKTQAVSLNAKPVNATPVTVSKKVSGSKALAALVAYQKESKVLGATTVNSEEDAAKCSFKQGAKLYSNKSVVTIDKADLSNQVCIGLKNTSSTSFLWDVEGNNSKGNCVDLSSYNLSNGNIDVLVKVENGENPSECSLLVKKIN